ncbi:MAG: OsmC family protein [Desulfovibrionaceae bacterium]|nr:OsmC family protein [Desulfovibrionaceae bacterium]
MTTSPQMTGIYLGDLRIEYTHLQSGDKIVTRSLLSGDEKPEAFMASDLTACSLAGCALTIMAKQADVLKRDITGTTFTVGKDYAAEKPAHIRRIEVVFTFPEGEWSDKEKTQFERAAMTCPVHKSLGPVVEQVIRLVFPGDAAPELALPVMARGVYVGNLGVEYTHEASGARLVTDAPTDNGGRGAAFSPTDLCSSSLAGCGLTVMGRQALVLGVDLAGTTFTVKKTMAADPRRIAKIEVAYTFRGAYSEKERAQLERACASCPVHHSLEGGPDMDVTFNWPD